MWLSRSLTILLLLLSGSPAKAEFLGMLTASTNYLWRGVTQTDDQPAIALSLEYQHAQGWYLGAWSSNTRYGGEPGYEVDIYLGRLFPLKPATIDVAVRHYAFPTGGKHRYDFHPQAWERGESNAFTEVQLGASHNRWMARCSYSDNYLDSDHAGYYIELEHTQPLSDTVSLTLHYGIQHSRAIDDTPEHEVGDYSATLRRGTVFLTISNLTDNTDGRQTDRGRLVLGWSAAIRR